MGTCGSAEEENPQKPKDTSLERESQTPRDDNAEEDATEAESMRLSASHTDPMTKIIQEIVAAKGQEHKLLVKNLDSELFFNKTLSQISDDDVKPISGLNTEELEQYIKTNYAEAWIRGFHELCGLAAPLRDSQKSASTPGSYQVTYKGGIQYRATPCQMDVTDLEGKKIALFESMHSLSKFAVDEQNFEYGLSYETNLWLKMHIADGTATMERHSDLPEAVSSALMEAAHAAAAAAIAAREAEEAAAAAAAAEAALLSSSLRASHNIELSELEKTKDAIRASAEQKGENQEEIDAEIAAAEKAYVVDKYKTMGFIKMKNYLKKAGVAQKVVFECRDVYELWKCAEEHNIIFPDDGSLNTRRATATLD